MSASQREFRAGFDNESTADVFASLERLCGATAVSNSGGSPVLIAIGHQRYLDLDLKVKKNQIDGPPVWSLLKEIPAATLLTLQKIEFHYAFLITSCKDEEKYDKAIQRLHKLVSKLAQRLQRRCEDEQKKISVDGKQQRVEEPDLTSVTGCASILLSATLQDAATGP